MAPGSLQPKKPRIADVGLAIAAVEDSGSPLDLDAGDPDTSPASLGLPTTQEDTPCPHHRYVCANCGAPLHQTGS